MKYKKFTDDKLEDLYEDTMSCIEKANKIEDKELRLDMLKLAIATLFTIIRN